MQNLKGAREIDLLPAPRELELEEDAHDLGGWELVSPSDHRFAAVATDELNERIRSLGRSPLPVRDRPTGQPAVLLGRWHDPGIRAAATALDVTVTPDDPGEQGYVIAFGEHEDRPVALLAGSDAQGMLYAAVTFRRLLSSPDEGTGVRARAATIRDWPDFKIRNVARLRLGRLQRTDATLADLDPLDEVVDELEAEIDFWLRHKVNCLFGSFFFPDEDTDPALFEQQRARAAEVLAYADARGIDIRYVGGVDIGDYLTEDAREAAIQRKPGSHYEWAALDAHRQHAQRYADFVAETGGDMFSLHLDDQGGYLDPERWSERSEATRAMYGDDQAAATAEQFQVYFEALRDAAADVNLEAIPYPYHFQFAREGFPEDYEDWRDSPALGGLVAHIEDEDHAAAIQDSLCDYHEALADALPDDVSIVFREAHRKTFEAATELYPGHPFTIWIYPERNYGWRGTFTPQVRMAKTFYREDYRDTYFLAAGFPYADGRVQQLAQQEYLWETNRPDGTFMFTQGKRGHSVSTGPTGIQRAYLIPRIARILYGDDGPAIEGVLAANVSFRYVADPEAVAVRQHDAEDFHQVYDAMDGQAEDLAAAFEALDERYQGVEEVTGWPAFYYRYVGLAMLKAQTEAAVQACRTMIANNRTHEAIGEAEAGIKELPNAAETQEALVEATSSTLPKRLDGLESFDPLDYEATFAGLISLAEEIRDGGGVRAHLNEAAGDAGATVEVSATERTDRTVTYGYATVIGLSIELYPRFEVWDNLPRHDLVITVTDADGETIVEEHRGGHRFVQSWLVPRPVSIDLGDIYPGDLGIDVAFDDEPPMERYVLTADGDLRPRREE